MLHNARVCDCLSNLTDAGRSIPDPDTLGPEPDVEPVAGASGIRCPPSSLEDESEDNSRPEAKGREFRSRLKLNIC